MISRFLNVNILLIISWVRQMKGRAHASPFAALSFLDSEMYSFTAGLTEIYGEARDRPYDR